jgi:glycerophosphoryl diester phosphodiesterase
MVGGPHPQSVIRTSSGREVQLKVHQCVWSADHPGNSLAAVLECYRARVARAEIDVAILPERDFLVVHDEALVGSTVPSPRAPLLSEVVDAIAAEPYPTLLELDLKDWRPWPWPRVEELAALLYPVRDRVTFGGGADWNLRRLLHVEPGLRTGFTIGDYLDWVPPDGRADRNAYGYLDHHPLGRERFGSVRDYLWDRLGAILQLVPGARDIHVRLIAAEHMHADGLTDLADLLHARGMLLDLWTLNAGTAGWRERLDRALTIGADVITTETPRALAEAAATLRS